MLKITIPAIEIYDSEKNEFLMLPEEELYLEHSLLSISKWESKWNKPFISDQNKSVEELNDYIECMLLKDADPGVLSRIDSRIHQQVIDYINLPMTATTFSDDSFGKKKRKEIITNEIIYYWMFSMNIPKECERWHLTRLLTLIRVCSEKNNPDKKKMSKKEIYSRNKAINEARRKKFNTKG